MSAGQTAVGRDHDRIVDCAQPNEPVPRKTPARPAVRNAAPRDIRNNRDCRPISVGYGRRMRGVRQRRRSPESRPLRSRPLLRTSRLPPRPTGGAAGGVGACAENTARARWAPRSNNLISMAFSIFSTSRCKSGSDIAARSIWERSALIGMAPCTPSGVGCSNTVWTTAENRPFTGQVGMMIFDSTTRARRGVMTP